MLNAQQDFSVDLIIEGPQATVTISGYLDESASLSHISVTDCKVVIIDLGKLVLINSTGIRTWIVWLKREMSAPGSRAFILRNCSRMLIDQANMVQGFLPEGITIESFHVPFACLNCENIIQELYVSKTDFLPGTADTAEWWLDKELNCSECGSQMDMDVMPDKYFGFLKYRK